MPAGETAEILSERVSKTLDDFKLRDKVVCFSADNTNTNFGGVSRKGKENIFKKLKESLASDLVGIGCVAHIINNGVHAGVMSTIPFDIESILLQIYNYFAIHTVRTEELKGFCEFVECEFKPLLSTSKTRWQSLGPALERFLEIFEGVKSYFLS